MPDEPTLEELYEDAPCGYLSLDPGGVITRANRTFLRSLGVTADELVGRPLIDVMAAGSRLYAETHWNPRLALEGQIREMPVDLVRPDGTRLSVLLNATRADDGSVRASLFDATDRRRYERELIAARDTERAARQRTERLQRLSAALSGALVVGEVAEMLGSAVCAALDPRVCAVLHGGRTTFERREQFALPGPAVTAEYPLTSGSGAREIGRLVFELPAGRELTDDEDAFASACAAAAATALRRAELYAEMERRALHDALTGLPNGVLLQERIDHELARARRDGGCFAVALLGLDGFKLLNDIHGHAAGDEILRLVAARLRRTVREVDLVAHPAGDEFAVVFTGVGAADGERLAGKLIEALEAPLETVHGEVFVRASVGLVVADGQGGAEGVLRDADVAMMVAKNAGSGVPYARFDASMREQARQRVLLEEGLREALRDGHLRVVYQPIVRAADGAVSSMEALVRWQHPARGTVSPGEFIPVAEATGLIIDIGRWVLREATRQLGAWRRAGVVSEEVGITVNVSARQLDHGGFAADVADAIAAAGLDAVPYLVGLELTESEALNAPGGPATTRLADLDALGVRLLLDDFGTGLSSLARLRRLPFDTLKIDRAFVRLLGEGEGDGGDAAVVTAIVALAGALDLDVVAEGVETEEQLGRLRELGVGAIQGFLFFRPLPPAELEAQLAARSGVPA